MHAGITSGDKVGVGADDEGVLCVGDAGHLDTDGVEGDEINGCNALGGDDGAAGDSAGDVGHLGIGW